MKKVIFFAIMLFTILFREGNATDLQVSKNLSNVILLWTGGSVPYYVVRSTSPLFYYNNALLADNYFNTQIIDLGALTATDNFYYDVSGVGETPADESNPARLVPLITSLSPDYGKPGDTIIVNGNNFAAIDYDNIVLGLAKK